MLGIFIVVGFVEIFEPNSKMNEINAATSVYALIGYPVEHSLSPAFWNAAFSAVGINAVYVALSVQPKDIFPALEGLKLSGIKAVNVTRPHKKAAAEYCLILHDSAKETGIVNTIKFSSKTEGWNTDAVGFLNILKKHSLKISTALVLGDGASSKSVIWALKKHGVLNIKQIARKITSENEQIKQNKEEKKFFLEKLSWNNKNFTNSIQESDIIINTTPLGWREEDDIPGLKDSLNVEKSFVDLNYSKKSKILSIAREKCGLVIDGRELLYEQGLEAFKVLMNYAPPAEVIKNRIFD